MFSQCIWPCKACVLKRANFDSKGFLWILDRANLSRFTQRDLSCGCLLLYHSRSAGATDLKISPSCFCLSLSQPSLFFRECSAEKNGRESFMVFESGAALHLMKEPHIVMKEPQITSPGCWNTRNAWSCSSCASASLKSPGLFAWTFHR